MKLFVHARLFYVLMNTVCILVVLALVVLPAQGDENSPIFSHGAGPYALIIFSDYFCSPCQKLEKEMSKIISAVIERGDVRVTFVNLPLYKLTPLYGTYFLYALNASSTYKDALNARQFLFERASRLGAITEKHLERDFKAEGIVIKHYDIKPALAEYGKLIQKYNVRSTPTFVFVYLPKDIRKYSGSEPIKKGMVELVKAMEMTRHK